MGTDRLPGTWRPSGTLRGDVLEGEPGKTEGCRPEVTGRWAPAMKQGDATGAGAKKGIGWLGNRHGSENQVSRMLFHRLVLGIVPVEGDDDRSVR